MLAVFLANPQQQQASTILAQFQEHPDAWQRVPAILETSSNTQTKYIALQIMDRLIKTRWKVLPEEQRSGIRNFVVQVIVKTSSDDATMRREKSFLNKLNLILVQILKQEWCVSSFWVRVPEGLLAPLPRSVLIGHPPAGLTTGRPLSPKSSRLHKPTFRFARTIWSSSGSCRRRSLSTRQSR